jgi:hypothetical protein
LTEIPRPDMRMCTLVTSGNVAELVGDGWFANFWWETKAEDDVLCWRETNQKFIKYPKLLGTIPMELM